MAENLFIQLIARLNKSLSKTQIQTDLNDIEKTPFYIRVIARLNKSLTRRNIENSVQDAARNISVDVNARVSERELQQSYETARQNLENRIQNDPIEIPVNVDTEDIQQGQHQIHNLNNEARNARNIFTEYLNAREIFRAIANAIKMAVNEVKELNKAQTDLQIVTGKSNAEMIGLMNKYNEFAKDMSVTTKNVASSADEWLRQGKSVAETDELIKDSVILAKVGQIEAADATKYLTSAMNGFKTETSDVIGIVDKLTNVDLESATSAGGLAEAMSKCANSAEVAGVSMDSLIGYIATVAEVTQKSDSVVGESFKSILARMGKIKLNNWIDEDGKDISGEINDVEKTLAQFDIKLRNSATEFRNFEDVIYDVGMAWDKFSSVDQNAIANAFGGVYQRENVITLFENFSRALELSEVSANSAGTAYKKFEVYENSLEAATNRLTASFESLAYNTIDASFISNLANATASIVEFVDSTQLIKTGLTAGIFTGAIVGLTALGARMVTVRNNVVQFTQAMNLSRSSTAIVGTQYNALRISVNGLTEEQLRLVLSSRQLTEAQRLELMQSAGIEQARQRQLLQTWNLTNATNAETVATFSLRGAWEGLKASIASNPMGLVITALTLATTAISNYNQKQEELAEQAKESAEKYEDQAKSLEELKKKYEEICNSSDDEKTKNEQLNEIKLELIDTYKIEKDNLKELNLEREKGIDLLDKEFEKSNRNARNAWLDKNEEIVQKANEKMAYGGTDYFSTYLSDNNISESILKLFDNKDAFGDTGYVNLEFDYTDTVDRLEKLKNIYNEILEIQSNRKLTEDEQQLLSDVKHTLDSVQQVYDSYYDTYAYASKSTAQNLIENYLKTDSGKLENVGKETFNAWSKGLIEQATNEEEKRYIQKYIEDTFPNYIEYFNNLKTAKSKFVEGKFNAKPISDYIESLSEDDLAVLIQLNDDVFNSGLDNVTKAIAKWKADPANDVTLSLDDEELSKTIETVSKKVKLISTAMEELDDTGYISSSTYAEIIEMGGNFTDCLETQNGKLVINVKKLKELETQEFETAKSATELAIAELKANTSINSASDYNAFEEKLNALQNKKALYDQMIDEINNASPKEKKEKKEKPQSVLNFEKELAEKQHEINMGQREENEDYYSWLLSAAHTAYDGLADYQDDLWKYEEEVYKGRKQLADNFYDEQQKDFEDRISNLENDIEIATNYSTDSDGNKLNVEEKYDYISSAYQEIINEFNSRIGKILDTGIEGHEEDVAKLEQQIIEYQEKLAELPKTAAEEEQTYIKKLKDDYSDLYDERIKKLKKQKEATEKAFKAEIDAIQKKIDALKDANDKEQEALDIEKARKELEKASQSTRQVYGSDGSISFKVDDEKVKEAQENLDKLMQEKQINILEKQKQALEDVKTKESEAYDSIIDNLETEKDNSEKRFDILLDVLDKYLNPDQGESNSDVWKMLAHLEGATYKNGVWTDKDGKAIDIDELVNTVETAKKDDKQTNTENNINNGNTSNNTKDNGIISGNITRLSLGSNNAETDNVANNITDKIETGIVDCFTLFEKKYNIPSGSLTLDKVSSVLSGSFLMRYNDEPFKHQSDVGINEKYSSNINNNKNNNSVSFNGDININNPVSNSDDLAKELMLNIPIAFQKQMYSNLGR